MPAGLAIQGKLAESFELDPGGKFIRFQLRQGVKSNWGNELTAEDVKWTWDRKFALGALGAFFLSTLGLENKDGVKVEGKYTVSINLDQSKPACWPSSSPISTTRSTTRQSASRNRTPTIRGRASSSKTIPPASAPTGLEQLQRGQQAVFKARDDYYRGKPAIDTVIFREVPTSATRASLLQGGAVDIAQYLQPLEIIKLRGAEGVAVDSVDASFMIWLELNAQIEPFNNAKVRQAMNFAFPQEQVLKTVFQGLAIAAQRLHAQYLSRLYATSSGPTNTIPIRPRLCSRRPVLSSGFKTSLAYNAGDPVQEPIAILYQTALRDVGVELELKKIPPATFYNTVSERKQPIIFYVDSPWCPDVGYSMTLYFNSKSFVNYSNYKNDDVDALIRDTARTNDQATAIGDDDQGAGDRHVGSALDVHCLSRLSLRAAGQPQGLHLLHLEQHPLPGFQPGGMSNLVHPGRSWRPPSAVAR